MKNLLRASLATATIAMLFTTASRASTAEPGFVDIGQFTPSSKGEYVEVNLSQGLLKFVAKLAAREEPEAAELIANLKRIRVNVVGLDESNRSGTIEKINTIRASLASQGWTQIVTVREKDGGDNVDVHVKQQSDDAIEGLVVTVIDRKGEAVIVNIVGNISADQIGKIADKFDIAPLKKVHVKINSKHSKPAKEPADAPDKQV